MITLDQLVRNTTLCIPTRGGVDLQHILDSTPFSNVIVWDNSKQSNLRVFGRYAAAMLAATPIIATQDDDAIIEDWPAILAAYEPGVVACNMGEAHTRYYAPMRMGLVGFGAIFDASLVQPTFERYMAAFPQCGETDDERELYQRECDRIFTGLNSLKPIRVPYRSFEHEQTMWREKRHGSDLQEIRRRLDLIRAKGATA